MPKHAQRPSEGDELQIQVTQLSDFLLHFYVGREPRPERFTESGNWYVDTAMALGIGIYVIYLDGVALIYDTLCNVAQGRWVRSYLEKIGIKRFWIVHSHWHLDHIGGDAAFRGESIIAQRRGRDFLSKNIERIKEGTLWGPPAIAQVILPNITYEDELSVYVGNIEVQLRHVNIHSIDGTVLYLPQSRILLCGDTLEDPLTYIVEVENLPDHLRELKRMRTWKIDTIYPNHGDPQIIRETGYGKALIDVTIQYINGLLNHAQNCPRTEVSIDSLIGDALRNGSLHMWDPYKVVHARNVKQVLEYWRGRRLPAIYE